MSLDRDVGVEIVDMNTELGMAYVRGDIGTDIDDIRKCAEKELILSVAHYIKSHEVKSSTELIIYFGNVWGPEDA